MKNLLVSPEMFDVGFEIRDKDNNYLGRYVLTSDETYKVTDSLKKSTICQSIDECKIYVIASFERRSRLSMKEVKKEINQQNLF